MQFRNIIPWLAVVFVLSLPLWLTPDSIPFREFNSGEVLRLLGSVALIALFLERVLEVFITTWRGPEANVLDTSIQILERKLTMLKKESNAGEDISKIKDTENSLDKATKNKSKYKSETQRIALWSGLTLGLLISAVGIRMLYFLVDPIALENAPQAQELSFRLVDVFVTGGLIAGGSDGIHKIFNVYDSLMESTSERLKSQPNKKDPQQEFESSGE